MDGLVVLMILLLFLMFLLGRLPILVKEILLTIHLVWLNSFILYAFSSLQGNPYYCSGHGLSANWPFMDDDSLPYLQSGFLGSYAADLFVRS